MYMYTKIKIGQDKHNLSNKSHWTLNDIETWSDIEVLNESQNWNDIEILNVIGIINDIDILNHNAILDR